MLGITRHHLLQGILLLMFCVGLVSVALIYFFPAPPTTITIAAGPKGSAYERIAERYRDLLARSGVTLEIRSTTGSMDNLNLLQDSKADVQLALVQGGVSNGKKEPDVMSLGRVDYHVVWIFSRATDHFDDLTQIKDRNISVDSDTTQIIVEKILAANGVMADHKTLQSLSGAAAAKALHDGSVDVIFLSLAAEEPVIRDLLDDGSVRPLSLQRADALIRIFPFLVKLTLPQGVTDLSHNMPSNDVTLVATTNSLLVRKDLHPSTINLLAQILAEVHGEAGLFQKFGELPTQMDGEYPMSKDAIEFYKFGPPMMDNYVPGWISVHLHRLIALLAAVGAIVLPIYSLAPGLWRSFIEFRLGATYRRLREIEASLHVDSDALEVETLDHELAALDRKLSIFGIPTGNSDLYFSIKEHLRFVHDRVNARRAELGKVT